MATLCPGVQYGLSTEENFSENKILIFVKLTDSAFVSVQQHLKNQVSRFLLIYTYENESDLRTSAQS